MTVNTTLADFDAQIEHVSGTLATVRAEMAGLDNIKTRYSRAFSPAEAKRYDDAEESHRQCELRIEQLIKQRAREVAACEQNERYGLSRGPAVVTRDSSDYRPDGEHSFFADLFRSRYQGDTQASERLARNQRARTSTRVALNTTAGTGGEFVPPAWLEDQFVAMVRPARATADILTNLPLPPGTDQLNVPKISAGSQVAIQGTQNTLITETDLTTTSVSSGVWTLAGGQTLSVQLFDQSPVAGQIDRIVLADLAADYARNVGTLVINGTGTGQPVGLLGLAGTTTVSYTDASPALMGPGKLYSKIAQAIQSIQAARFLPPTHIVLHPRRWAWINVAVDANNRPAVLPSDGGPFNASGLAIGTNAQGPAGRMFGLDVIVDPNVPTNLGAGTNQDPIIVFRAEDSWLWESTLRADIFPQTFSQNASMYCRVYNYLALIHRLAQSIAVINGTGLVTPTW